jgi:hypothetical protein
MEQRPLRLGDILDDYCPRERRLTNHAVVAMIEENIKQTRCTTCDTEHPYKGGKVPRRRKKETPAALYKEVLSGMPETEGAPVLAGAADLPSDSSPLASDDLHSEGAATEAAPEPRMQEPIAAAARPHVAPADGEPDSADEQGSAEAVEVEEGPVHRPLIRAQLPRIEGMKEERRLPEFTIRQATRGGPGHFRGADSRMKQQRPGGQGGNGNGNRPQGGSRFAGARPAPPGRGPGGRGGPAAGFRAGQPRHGGKKRSR